jgi:hypothetical protein
MRYMNLLGYECQDTITGFKGVASSVCFDVYGCIQIALSPPVEKKTGNLPDGKWFDAKRLKKIGKAAVMAAPDFSLPEIGAADKPAFRAMPSR